jgi:hypothetical protein
MTEFIAKAIEGLAHENLPCSFLLDGLIDVGTATLKVKCKEGVITRWKESESLSC